MEATLETLAPSILTFLGMIAIAGVAWGKFNQLITQISRRVTTLEGHMETLRGHGMQSAVTRQICQSEKAACSTLVCTKLDALQETIRQMECRREESRSESQNLRLHITKIAQYIEDKDGKKINGQ